MINLSNKQGLTTQNYMCHGIVASLMMSLLPLRPGVRTPRSHDTSGGPGHVTVHSQRGSSQTAGQEPPDIHPADHQADPHRSPGVWGHSAASPCGTAALRLHQRQCRQSWVYVHTFINTTLVSIKKPIINMITQTLCDPIICTFFILWVPSALF